MSLAEAAALDFPYLGFPDPEFPTFRKWAERARDHFIPHERNNYHPHILGHRFLGLVSLLLIVFKVTLISAAIFSPAASIEAEAITSDNVVTLTNADRTQMGIAALSANAKLSLAAQAKADALAACSCFQHNLPDGRTPWSFIQAAGYNYISAGENLAVDFSQAENIEVAWMNSPGHRANLLNKDFEQIGVGISTGQFQGHATTFVVQMFGAPIAQQVALQSAPTPVAPQSSPAPVKASSVQVAPAKIAATTPPAPTPAPVSASTPPTAVNPPIENQPVQIIDTSTSIQDGQLALKVTTAGPAVKVIANFNQAGLMLYPKSDTVWQVNIPLVEFQGQTNLSVAAADISGHSITTQIASFAPTLQANYHALGSVASANINLFGATIDPHAFAQNFYLVIIAALVVCLILAIAVHRHVQHLGLIANGSFVVILAALLLMAG